MMGDLRRPGIAVALLERGRRPLVPGRPDRDLQPGVEHLADQRMDEPEAAPGCSRDQPGRLGFGQGRQDGAARSARSPHATRATSTSAPRTEAAARDVPGRVGQPVQPAGHHGADARLAPGRDAVGLSSCSSCQRKNGLPPLCRCSRATAPAASGLRGLRRVDQGRHVARAEPTEADVQPVADQLGQTEQPADEPGRGRCPGRSRRSPAGAGGCRGPGTAASGSCPRPPSAGHPGRPAVVARPRRSASPPATASNS